VAWLLHRLIVKAIRKIKFSSATGVAGDQQYIWTPGLTEGAPDRILDIPYGISEYCPSSIATGLYTAVLGNFRYFRIAELPTIAVQRLVELYAANGEVGFIGRSWVDGSPVLGEAFARLKQP
jgi:HK97 family phage major capsid protein